MGRCRNCLCILKKKLNAWNEIFIIRLELFISTPTPVDRPVAHKPVLGTRGRIWFFRGAVFTVFIIVHDLFSQVEFWGRGLSTQTLTPAVANTRPNRDTLVNWSFVTFSPYPPVAILWDQFSGIQSLTFLWGNHPLACEVRAVAINQGDLLFAYSSEGPMDQDPPIMLSDSTFWIRRIPLRSYLGFPIEPIIRTFLILVQIVGHAEILRDVYVSDLNINYTFTALLQPYLITRQFW